eukprot:3908998-Ditylum_brightwellii.AAC.1
MFDELFHGRIVPPLSYQGYEAEETIMRVKKLQWLNSEPVVTDHAFCLALDSWGKNDDNGGCRAGSRPSKIKYDTSHLSAIAKKFLSRPFNEYIKKN